MCKYSKQLNVNELGNLDEQNPRKTQSTNTDLRRNNFLTKHTSKEIKSVIKIALKKILDTDSFTDEFYQSLKG